jgi:hypothetical protein
VALVMRTGLDYAALPVVAPLTGVTLNADVFGQLRLLEAFAKAAMAEADERRMREIGA